MAIAFDYLRNAAARGIERVGSRLGVPETGISERISGSNNFFGQPANTARYGY